MAERLCAHEPCACAPAPGQRYCSARCVRGERARGGERADRCPCGHPECRPENDPVRTRPDFADPEPG